MGANSAEESVADLFWGAARRLRELSRESLAPWDITPSQARAVRVLARHGSMRAGELSDHLRISPRSATEVIDAIEQRGLVERAPDPTDRRATIIALSAEGQRVVEALRVQRTAETQRFFGELNASDQATLRRILRRLQG